MGNPRQDIKRQDPRVLAGGIQTHPRGSLQGCSMVTGQRPAQGSCWAQSPDDDEQKERHRGVGRAYVAFSVGPALRGRHQVRSPAGPGRGMAGAEQGQLPRDSSMARREPLGGQLGGLCLPLLAPSETQLGANVGNGAEGRPNGWSPNHRCSRAYSTLGNRQASSLPQSLPTL